MKARIFRNRLGGLLVLGALITGPGVAAEVLNEDRRAPATDSGYVNRGYSKGYETGYFRQGYEAGYDDGYYNRTYTDQRQGPRTYSARLLTTRVSGGDRDGGYDRPDRGRSDYRGADPTAIPEGTTLHLRMNNTFRRRREWC